MKYSRFVMLVPVLGALIFVNNSHAAPLDCNKYNYSPNAFAACNTLNQTVAEAKKEDEARFAQLLGEKQLLMKSQMPQRPQTSATVPSSQSESQQIQSNDTVTQTPPPVTQPENVEPQTVPEPQVVPEPQTVPEPQPPAPKNEPKRIQYY